MSKRTRNQHVILLARHYPPHVSGGTRRASLLARGLRDRGWRVSVASPAAPLGEPDWIETPHPAAERAVADASPVTSSTVAARATALVKRALRRWLYWPDGDMRWALTAAARVTEAIRVGDAPAWVITSSPPESAHLAGAIIKRKTGVPWLAELRDGWIVDPLRVELRRSRVRRAIERRLARRLLAGVDHLVAVSTSIAEELASLAPAGPVSVIGHFAERTDAVEVLDGAGPHLVHTGQFSLSHPDRRLVVVLDAYQTTLATHPTAILHLVGRLTPEETRLVHQHPIGNRVQLYGVRSYEESRAYQRAADGLLLFQPDTAALPGKLAEYLLCNAPILTVGGGRWLTRLEGIPHWPLEQLTQALAAGPRQPIDAYSEALDRYETLLSDSGIAQRRRS